MGASSYICEGRSIIALRFSFVFACAFCVLLVAQAPALWTVFAHHDQYRYFAETLGDPAIKQSCEADRQYLWLYKIGRPLTAEIECAVFRHVSAPVDLTPFRQLVVLIQALAVAVLAYSLRPCGLTWEAGGALGAAIFLLPGEQNAVFMANIPNALTPIVALVSHRLLERARVGTHELPRDVAGIGLAFLAWLALVASMHLFLGLTVFFFTMTFAYVLFRGDERGVRLVTRDAAFFGSAALFYYVLLVKWYAPTFSVGQQIPSNYALGMSFRDIAFGCLKTVWYVPAMANLWNIYPTKVVGLAVVLPIFLARLAAEYRQYPGINRLGGIGPQRLLLLFATFGIANVVIIAAPVALVYRVLVGQTAILVLWLFASLAVVVCLIAHVSWEASQRPVAFILLGVAAILASWTTSENVFASASERAYVRSAVTDAPQGHFDEIAIVQPPYKNRVPGNRGLNGRLIIGDEFNMPTSLGSMNLGSDVPDMARAALIEAGRYDRPVVDASLPIRCAGAATIVARPDGTVIVHAPNGWQSRGRIRGDLVLLPMGIIGVLSADRRTIRWNAGVDWLDPRGQLSGSWTAVLDPRAIIVTRHWSGDIPKTPRTLVIDLTKARFPSARW